MKYLVSALATAGLVAGHGYVTNGTIDGVSYTFYQPYTDPYTSPTPERISRPIQGNGPITNVTSADIQCGGYSDGGIVGSSPAALHAPATAGSNVTLFWTLWPDSHYGALTTYMARCPDTGCQDYMPNSTAVWFKIAEAGMEKYNGGGASDDWAVDPLMVNGNAGYTYTIPDCLADGYYLVRHEILAVFVASTYPGLQAYPGCHQLNVTGGGSTTVSDLVSFPGAYAGTDPGITWDSSSTTYPIPGPTVMSCSGSSSSSSSGSDNGSESAASSSVASSAAATSSAAAVETSSPATTLSTAVVAAAATDASNPSPAVATPTADSSTSTCSTKRSLRRRASKE